MGLLDDAIREHLELKRRRGADPTEVARAEQEALGPVRREPEAAEQAPAQDHGEPEHPHAGGTAETGAPVVEDQPEHPPFPEPDDATRVIPPSEAARAVEDAPRAEPPAPARREPEPAPAPAVQADEIREPAPESRQADLPTEQHHAAAPDPAAPAPPPREADDARRSDIVDQPTTEYRLEDLEEDDGSHTPPAHATPEPPPAPEQRRGSDDDVLEETPDFLQETPEHDRLWFEQRPPRDFDFDG